MTSIDEHKKKIKEHLEEIEDAIDQGIENKPATIGFHSSACSMQLLELYLHILNKITIGKVIKHDWFKKPQKTQKIEPLIERKLQIQFPIKEQLYNLIYDIEDKRNNLMYGKTSKQEIKNVLTSFQKLKQILIKKLSEEGIKIES